MGLQPRGSDSDHLALSVLKVVARHHYLLVILKALVAQLPLIADGQRLLY